MITDYPGYETYEQMIAHAGHHGDGVDLDYEGCKAITSELAALRTDNATLAARLAELEKKSDDMFTEVSKWINNYAECDKHRCELEAQINTGKVAAAAAIDYLDSLEYSGHCYQLLLNWYSTPTQAAQPVTLTPRQCGEGRECYRKGWEAARDKAVRITNRYPGRRALRIHDCILSLTPPDDCGDCNPLAPSLVDNCGSCKNFKRCESIFGCKPEATECDWIPSKFERA